jgi:hypothetical protein
LAPTPAARPRTGKSADVIGWLPAANWTEYAAEAGDKDRQRYVTPAVFAAGRSARLGKLKHAPPWGFFNALFG